MSRSFYPFCCYEKVKNDVTRAIQDCVILSSLSFPKAFLSLGVTNDPSSTHKFSNSLIDYSSFLLHKMNWNETNSSTVGYMIK